jgi:hypothetical protein
MVEGAAVGAAEEEGLEEIGEGGPEGFDLCFGHGASPAWDTGRIRLPRQTSLPRQRCSVSPDGKRLASAGGTFDNTVRLWDENGKEVAVLNGHTGPVVHVAYSPDGKRLASASEDGTVRLWDQQGKEVAVLRGHTRQVIRVAFSPDGKRLASASQDRTEREQRRVVWRRQQAEAAEKWHQQQAEDAQQRCQWFAAAFHLSRLIDRHPDAANLRLGRAKVSAAQGQWLPALADLAEAALLQRDGVPSP